MESERIIKLCKCILYFNRKVLKVEYEIVAIRVNEALSVLTNKNMKKKNIKGR